MVETKVLPFSTLGEFAVIGPTDDVTLQLLEQLDVERAVQDNAASPEEVNDIVFDLQKSQTDVIVEKVEAVVDEAIAEATIGDGGGDTGVDEKAIKEIVETAVGEALADAGITGSGALFDVEPDIVLVREEVEDVVSPIADRVILDEDVTVEVDEDTGRLAVAGPSSLVLDVVRPVTNAVNVVLESVENVRTFLTEELPGAVEDGLLAVEPTVSGSGFFGEPVPFAAGLLTEGTDEAVSADVQEDLAENVASLSATLDDLEA